MEPTAGAPLRAHGLRPLGLPRPVTVELDADGEPARVTLRAGRGAARAFGVEQVQERWRIAEAWWREAPVRRTYYRIAIDGGRALTLFHDDAPGGGWYEQRY